MCSTRLAGNRGRKNDAKKSPSVHYRTTLSDYIFATKARIDNRKKNLLSSNISSTCPYSMVNFGPLAAEIVSLVWGTPTNFNGFRFLAALLHSITAVFNRGRHLHSAGRPSRWALAHISSWTFFASSYCWDVTGRNLSTKAIFEGGGSLRSPILGGRGRRPPTTVGWQKTRRITLLCGMKISPVGSLD